VLRKQKMNKTSNATVEMKMENISNFFINFFSRIFNYGGVVRTLQQRGLDLKERRSGRRSGMRW
jgi:hypothetical protein